MKKLEGKSKDILDENISKIKEIFPEVFEEGKIDFEYLRKVLGDSIDSENEKYSFNWNGKSDAIKTALKPTTATLRPDKESSKDWDKTENLFIEGDNLEVLKVLQDSYRNKVKMIYIDPPYNTGKDFVYSDKFNDTVDDYKERTEQAMVSNADTSGRYHTNWLNMMYPRLRLARNLLKDDGVIFISIDDNEFVNLKKVCDEIFGEQNFLGNISVVNNLKGRSDDEFIATAHEYLIVYSKNSNNFIMGGFSLTDEMIEEYNKEDEIGRYKEVGFRKTGKGWRREDRPNMYYPIYFDKKHSCIVLNKNFDCIEILPLNSDGEEGRWRWGKDTFAKKSKNELVVRKLNNGKYGVFTKMRLEDNDDERTLLPKSIWLDTKYDTAKGSKILKELFNVNQDYFENPKPVEFIKDILIAGSCNNSFILDFFSGSGTTGHAAMDLNAEDGGNRKFILVQIPEKTDEKSEVYKAGYKTISEISMERIRRAGEKIKQDNKDKEGIEKLDIGFKAFKLDSTNLTQWDSQTKDLKKTLEESINSAKSDRTQEDVLYEVLLKYGINLTTPITSEEINGKKVFSIAGGYLLICLEKDIDLNIISKIAEKKPERVVFYDHGFKDDMTKLNAEQTLKKAGVEDIRVI